MSDVLLVLAERMTVTQRTDLTLICGIRVSTKSPIHCMASLWSAAN